MAENNALKFSDLFDLNDQKAINKLVETLQKVGKAYEKQVDLILKANKDLLDSQKQIENQAKDNKKTLDKLNPSLEEQQEDIEKLAKSTDELADKNDKINKTIKENSKQVENLKGKLKANNDLTEKIIKTNTTYEKLQKQIAEATSEEAFENEKLKQQLNLINAERRKAAKQAAGLLNTYQEESKRLNDLRNKYKSLRLEQGKNSKEVRELRAEIVKLDQDLKDVDEEVGQFQRSVGNYQKVNEGAKASFKSLTGLILGAFLGGIVKTRKQTREFQILISQIGNVAKTAFVALSNGITEIVIPAFQKGLNNVKIFGKETKLFFKDLVPDALKDEEDFAAIEKLKSDISELNDKNKELTQTITDADNPFKGLLGTIDSTNSRIREQLELQDQLINQQAILIKQINDLAAEEELLQLRADDTTLGFQARIEANKELLATQEERFALQQTLAQKEQDIAVLAIKNDLEREGVLNQVSEARIKDLTFLKDKNIADLVSIENLEALKNATIELRGAEIDSIKAREEGQKLLAELYRDNFEIELDFAIDDFDSIKTVNEQKIGDERNTLDERFKILKRTVDLAQESFDDQIALTEKFRAERLAIEQGISEDEAREKLKRIDINQLVLEDDQRVVRERLRAADIDEKTLIRILEIIKERRLAVNDLATAERDLNDELKQTSDILVRDLAALEEAFKGEAFQIDTTQLNKLIELRERLNSVEDPQERKAILDEVIEIEKEASDERLDIVSRELEGRKSILEQELKTLKSSGEITLQQEEDIAKQIADIDQQLLDQKLALNEKEIAAEKQKNDEIIAFQKQRKQEILQVSGQLALEGAAIVDAGFQREIESNNNALAELERRKELEVALAGDNAQRKAEIELAFFQREEEIRAKQREALRKQAIFEKTIAIAQITINTAQAIARTLAEVPKFDFGISTGILVGLYAGLGAAQIATVLATPIPEFEKGTMNAPEGLAWTDEKGAEIHTDKDGNIKDLGSDKGPRLKMLGKGDKIYTAEQSKSIISMLKDSNDVDMVNMTYAGMGNAEKGLSQIFVNNNGGLTREDVYKSVSKAMKERPENHFTWNEKGYDAYQRRKNSITNYMHGKNLGK